MNLRDDELLPFDVYSDEMELSITESGASLSFGKSSEGDDPDVLLGVVRVSNEMLKLMAYFIRESMAHHQDTHGLEWNIPRDVLEGLGVDIGDWEKFWVQDGQEGT